MLKVGQVWRGVVRSKLRSFGHVTEDGDMVFIGDDPTVPAVIDVLVKRLPDPRFPNLVLVEALDVERPSGVFQYWEEVERVVAGKLDPC
jgi:hypothetical protein